MIIQQPYKNGIIFKFKNKRVTVCNLNNGIYAIQLKTLSNDLSPRAIHLTHKDCIVETGFVLSEEVATCIAKGLLEQLIKDGVITINDNKTS